MKANDLSCTAVVDQYVGMAVGDHALEPSATDTLFPAARHRPPRPRRRRLPIGVRCVQMASFAQKPRGHHARWRTRRTPAVAIRVTRRRSLGDDVGRSCDTSGARPSTTINTRMQQRYDLADIAGISKTPYGLGTPLGRVSRHGSSSTTTTTVPSDPQDATRRLAPLRRPDRRSPQPPVAGEPLSSGQPTGRRCSDSATSASVVVNRRRTNRSR